MEMVMKLGKLQRGWQKANIDAEYGFNHNKYSFQESASLAGFIYCNQPGRTKENEPRVIANQYCVSLSIRSCGADMVGSKSGFKYKSLLRFAEFKSLYFKWIHSSMDWYLPLFIPFVWNLQQFFSPEDVNHMFGKNFASADLCQLLAR